ncbi:MAG TPA: RNA polymerase factor sigma-54 [Burkholderiales bacterium]|nr:RNA polymerase factor sigma-54 [Burkholderiales bacterium]
MKPALQLRLSQHLTLTPQLQQSIRLLQLSTVELNQEIEQALAENPILERDEGEADGAPPVHAPAGTAPAAEEAPAPERQDDITPEFASPWQGGEDDGDNDRSISAHDAPTLRDHLNEQLSLLNVQGRDRTMVELLIDSLDEDGYLKQSLEEIALLLPPEAMAGVDELAIALRHLQNMEPVGIGARGPSECLALQLRPRCTDDPAAQLALRIVEHHLDLLAARDYVRLKTLTGADDEALRTAQTIIQGLNPRPGAVFARLEARYVVPDVIVRKVRGTWRASLNPEAMPRLRINRLYAELASGRANSGAGLASKLQEARWLIKNVRQRFDTILRVAQAIVERQRHFLDHGEVAMRPMVLREIADMLGLHESTISRVTTQKYMATPRGTFELKYFFGSHVATETGGAASATAIRALLRQLVAAEDARAPLSDAQLARILGKQGIVVARRTIAKYRESLLIPPVRQRRAL